MDVALRNRYMQAMGIPVWMPKAQAVTALTSPDKGRTGGVSSVSEVVLENPVFNSAQVKAIGISSPPEVVLENPTPTLPLSGEGVSTLSWDELRTTIQTCTRCDLSKTRTQTVFGVGNQQADWMIIGEAPGAEEDRRGEPFVGKAGQLLNNMLAAIGLPRETVYIANVLKCRPPNNRDPKPDEAAHCRGYLERQIALVQPRLILVVGRIAAQNLLQTTAPLARLRNQVHREPLTNTPVIATYHPAYLLRQPADKRKAWQDLLFAQQVFARHVTTN